MNEIISGIWNCSLVWGSPFVVLGTSWLWPPKGTSSDCTLSILYHWFAVKLFPVGYAQSTRKTAGFWPWLRVHIRNFQNFSGQQNLLPTHVWECHRESGDLLYLTGVMVHFRYYKRPEDAQALRYLSHFARIWRIIPLLKSANFSKLDSMDKMNFWNLNFLWFRSFF